MNELAATTSIVEASPARVLPPPRCAVSIRPATLGDLPFIDGLQKANSKSVGFLRATALQGKVAAGQVLIAVGATPASRCGEAANSSSTLRVDRDAGVASTEEEPLGYVIGTDRYFKREDVGIIYQLNVVPGMRRHLVGATLIKAMFERSAYGCKLYCCWCAQDLAANRFWEALGFIPLAFRAGSAGKGRIHIFWQRRIREGDTTTPYWFPSMTDAGSIREQRLVLPIPPGVKWSDEMPIILPGGTGFQPVSGALEDRRHGARATTKPREVRPTIAMNGLRLGKAEPKSKQKTPRAKARNDPLHVAAARELNALYMERFNSEDRQECLSHQKYEVSRALAEPTGGWRNLAQQSPKMIAAA